MAKYLVWQDDVEIVDPYSGDAMKRNVGGREVPFRLTFMQTLGAALAIISAKGEVDATKVYDLHLKLREGAVGRCVKIDDDEQKMLVEVLKRPPQQFFTAYFMVGGGAPHIHAVIDAPSTMPVQFQEKSAS
jgi:hypothetical protein